MYNAFFVNQLTGEVIKTSDPKNNPTNIFYPETSHEGWSQIHFDLYQIMMNVRGRGKIDGIRLQKECEGL